MTVLEVCTAHHDSVRRDGTHLPSRVAVIILVLISESELIRVSLPHFFICHFFTHALLTFTTNIYG